jgi:hypothetical protein
MSISGWLRNGSVAFLRRFFLGSFVNALVSEASGFLKELVIH